MKKRILFHKPHFLFSIPTLLIFSFLLFAGSQAFGVVKTTASSGTWAAITWSPAGLPVAGDDIVIAHNVTAGPAVGITNFASFTVNSGVTFTHTNTAITITGDLTVNGVYQINNQNFTVNGATTVSSTGSLNDNNHTGANRFDGLVTINASGVFSSAVTSTYEFRNGILHNGATCSLTGGGTISFTTNSQSISGGSAVILNIVSITNTLSLTNTNSVTCNGAVTVSGSLNLNTASFTANTTTTLSGTGSIVDDNNAGSNLFIGQVTVPAGCSFSSSNNSTYTFRGGITHNGTTFSLTGTGQISFTTNAQNITGASAVTLNNVASSINLTLTNTNAVTFSGAVTLTAGALNLNVNNFTAGSTLALSGTATLVDNSNTGSNIFVDQVNVGVGCSFSSGNSSPFEFRNGISHSGTTFSLTAPTVTFSTNNQALNGTSAYTINTISVANITLTNNGTLTVANACDGTTGGSNFTNGTNANLTYNGSASLMGTGSLTANSSGNSVTYSGAAQGIRSTATGYFNLTTGGSAAKTIFQNLIVANVLTIGNGTTFRGSTFNVTTTTMTLNGNGIFSKSGAGSILVSGAVTLNGTSNINSMTGNPTWEFESGITQNSTAASNLGTGQVLFSTNNQSINGTGSGAITFGGNVLVGDDGLGNGIVLTNTRNITITGTLNGTLGTSQLVNDVNASLSLASSTTPFGTGSLVASSSGNTVTFSSGSNQTIPDNTYHNIIINGAGTKTIGDITVNGNFTQSTGTISSTTGTQTFATATVCTLSVNASGPLNNIVLNKSGGLFNLNSSLTVTNGISVNGGSLVYIGTARTLTINGDLNGAGTINMSALAGHRLVLNGQLNSIGTLTTIAGNTVSYTRAGDQSVFASPNYANLTVGGSGIKTIGGNVNASGAVTFSASVLLSLSNFNFTLGTAGTLVSSAGAFGLTKMIVTDGSGLFTKQGTTAANFSAFVTQTPAASGLIPLGTTGFYSPMNISSLAATVAGTGTITVRAVAAKQPNVPYFNNALVKYWEVASTNLSAITANMAFTFSAGEVIGSVGFYVPRVWDGSTLSAVAGGSAPGSNPFSTTGTTFLTGSWTAIDPTVRNAFYSYISGDWNTAGTWTTDPSGTTLINSAVPTVGDQVFILNGRTVTNAASGLTTASLTIENGAVLDIAATTGHNFGPVTGSGLYRQSSITLPTANFTNFCASTGGTFEYYNLPAGVNELDSTLTTYNNLLITNSTGTNFTIALDTNMTLNGNFTSSRTGAGRAAFVIGNTATARTVNITGNINVGTGTTFKVGRFNAAHTINLFGNLTNSDSLFLTNATVAYTLPTNGYATINFRGITTNTAVTSNTGSFTRFDNFIVIKNTGFELFVTAAAGATPTFWSNAKTIDVTTGTLRLGPNVVVDRMISGGGNYDLGSSTTIPTFWIDGATVTFGPGLAIVPYGTLRVSAGTLNVAAGQGGIVLRETGQLQIEGTGTVNAWMFRTSTTATTHRGAFNQTGGTFNLSGINGGINHYSIFTLPYPDNVFRMTGGTINITKVFTGGITPNGGIQIASSLGNYEVTGGTINVTVGAGINFDISSSSPLYDLTISKSAGAASSARLTSIPWSYDGSGGNTVTYPAQPLVILNDFTVNGTNSPVFDALNANVFVRGNFLLSNGGTYQSTTNTLTFDGASNQSFTVNGSLNTGLSSLAINKSSSTLTVAGTAATITVRAGLNISNGTLADGGKTINVAGDILNNGIHSGAGKIALNSAIAAQTISGTLNSIFGNLDFSNTNGAVGSTQITVSSNLQINGNLALTTDRVANIGNKQITLPASSNITGTFSINRHIKTNGLRSDGGIKKTYSSTAAITFPLGYGINYSPATIQFSATPTTWGDLTVRPVGTKQLYVTDPNCFDLYWKLETSGFTGIPANSVNYTFNYGNLTDDVTYIPAFYDQLAIAYTTISDVTQVNETTNNISFTGVSYTDGDFTAGNPAAFGIVTPYYSRTNGDWNTPATWSNVGFGGAASASIPASNSPVLIGDGGLFNHTVTITTNSTVSGSLIVDAGSTLDCQTTTGNNFGAIPYATAGGSGTIRISSASATAEFPAGDFGLFFQSTGGTCEYYSTGVQNFTLPGSTASPTVISIDTYRNLVLAPGSGRIIEFPNKDLEIYEDVTVNGNSTGIAGVLQNSARIIKINDDLNITNGILEVGGAASHIVRVTNNTTINSSGTLQTSSTGSNNHSIRLGGNLFNEGNIDLNNASTANLLFQGTGSRVWNGANGSANVDLFTLTINKGTSAATELEITTLGTFTVPSNNWLTLTNGNLKWSKAGTITLTNAVGDFTIPSSTALTLNNTGLTVNVNQVNSSDADVILLGKLSILNGTMNIGNIANNQHNDLEVGAAGIPEFDISGTGVLNVNGQIRRSLVVQFGSLKYSQSGNSTVLVRGKNPNAALSLSHDRGKFEILNAGSEFNMSGNSILTIDRNGSPSGVYYDIFIEPATFNITGGEIRVGTTSTPAAQTFFISSTAQLWNLSLDGTTNAKTLTLVGDPISIQKNLRIEGNSIFVANSLDVTIGGDLVNQNTTATGGLSNGGFQPTSATQVTTFNSATANQNITGTGANLTNFAVLTIANTFSGGSVTLGTNSAVRVAGQLNINTGTLNTGTNLLTALNNVVNNGGHTSSGPGFLVFGGASAQAIQSGSTASFGSVRVSNSAGVNAESPVNISGTLNLPNGILYLNSNLLSLGVTASVTGAFSSSNMIRLNGVTSDGGVQKSYPASASDFTFPIGTTLKYTPARFNVTSNSVAGTINIKPVNVEHPATTDVLDLQLDYYWRVNSTGFNGSTVVNHTYNYEPLDVNGTEASYVTGRFFGSLWAPTLGIPATVDASNDRFTLTGVNYFDGDYTAGENTEFNIITTFYSRNATLGGNWDDANAWSVDAILQHAGAAAPTFPNFNQAVIASGHTVNANGNGRNAVSVVVNGTLNLANSIAHNYGDVTGTGRIQQTATAGNQYIFPGGNYALFTLAGSGTFEFGGTTNGTLSTQATYNNVEFTGTATKNLPNSNITLNGNLTLTAGVLANPSNRNISLNGNWVNNVGPAGFTAGTGTVNLVGGSQTITGSTNFSTLSTTSAGTKTLTSSITATNNLTLTNGIITTGLNQITVNATASIAGGSSSSYVNGNLRRGIPAAATTTVFQIGDASAYTPATINYSGATLAGGFITANTSSGDHPQVYTSGIDQTKSANRYWTLTNSGVTGFTSYNADFSYVAGDLDVSANPLNFIVARYSGSVWTQPTVGTITGNSTQGISISGTTFGDFQVGQSVGGKIWTGATNTNWNIATNWIPASVPLLSENAIIGNVVNQPNFLTGGNGQCKDLILLAGANVTIPTGYILTVEENIDAAGNTIDGVGEIRINGPSSTLTGSLTINSNLTVNASATLVLGPGSTLNLGRDFTINGSVNPNSLPITFTGSNNSTVTGNIGFYDLVVNKSTSAGFVQLGSDITVDNQVNMQTGDIELNNFELDLGTTGTLVNETSANRVNGITGGTIRSVRTLNAPSSVNVGGLGAVLSSGVNLGSTEVIRKHEQAVIGVGLGTNRRYEIHPTNNSALNATLVFNYFDDELITPEGTIDEGELNLWRFNGTIWEEQPATLDMAANTLTKTGIPQFSEWTSGSYLNNPLDIDLAFFNLNCKGKSGTDFIWKTLREKDSKTFTLEASANGKNWEYIATTNAAGNSGEERYYKIMLPKIPSGFNQVRLTMMDGTGKKNIFNSLPLNCNPEIQVFNPTVYPNPGNGDFTLDLSGLTEMVYLSVLNIFGQEVAGQLNNGARNQKVKLDLKGYPAGIYRLQISSKRETGEPISKSINLVIR